MKVEKKEVWAARLASQLRLLGANMQEETTTGRCEFFTDEIKQALEGIPQFDHESYLDALASAFPGGEIGSVVVSSGEENEMSLADLSTNDLMDELVTRSSLLSANERRSLVSRLETSGLIVTQQVSSSYEELPEELAKRLSLPAGEKVNSRHALLLMSKLIGIILDLDQLVWAVWKALSPRSRIRRDSQAGVTEIGRNIGRYLTGDTNMPLADVVQPLERSRQLVAGLLGAIGPVGSTFARKFAQRFSPDDIRKDAKREGGSFLKAIEVRCWARYEILAKDLSEDQVEHDIREAISEYAESLISGRKF